MLTHQALLTLSERSVLQFQALEPHQIKLLVFKENTQICEALLHYLKEVLGVDSEIAAFDDDFVTYEFESINRAHTLQLTVKSDSMTIECNAGNNALLEVIYREENFEKLVAVLLPIMDPNDNMKLQKNTNHPDNSRDESMETGPSTVAEPVLQLSSGSSFETACTTQFDVEERVVDDEEGDEDDLYGTPASIRSCQDDVLFSTAPTIPCSQNRGILPSEVVPTPSIQPSPEDDVSMTSIPQDTTMESELDVTNISGVPVDTTMNSILGRTHNTDDDFDSFSSDVMRELSPVIRNLESRVKSIPESSQEGDEERRRAEAMELNQWNPLRVDYYRPDNKINQKRVDNSMPAECVSGYLRRILAILVGIFSLPGSMPEGH
eukprot:sb/3479394/